MKKIFYIIGLAILCTSCQNINGKQLISEDKVADALFDESGTLIDEYELLNVESEALTGDLEFPSPVVIETPNFEGNILPSASNKILKLKFESKKKNQIIDDGEWFSNNQLSLPTYYVINFDRNFEGNLPANIPQNYNDYIITDGFKYTNHDIFFYGSNYSERKFLLITNNTNTKIEHFLDFENFNYAPKTLEGNRAFVFQSIKWAVIENNILYISHGHSTYAESSFGMNAYISAIDLDNYEIIWTTQPLTCNSTFVLVDNSIVCGYGFTAEPDYLYVLDKHTGERKQTIKLDKGPSYIVQKDNKIFVRTYDLDYVFNIE